MKTILALAAGAAALVAASSANAAECMNGYMELGNQVIVRCDSTPMVPVVGVVAQPATYAADVLITGSIVPLGSSSQPDTAMSDDGCVNGYRTLGNQVITLCGWRR
jgi:hypothetical protein